MNYLLTAAAAEDMTKALPHALGPEKSLLSTMFNDPQEFVALAIAERLTPEHFYLPSHSLLFETLVEIFEAGAEIELVSLVQKLLDRGQLDRVGGPSALTDIYTYAPSSGGFLRHLRLVREKFVLRSLIRLSNETIASAYDTPEESSQLLDATEAAVMSIRDTGTRSAEVSISKAVCGVIEEMEEIIRGDRKAAGISTGFHTLDGMTRGLKPGEMFVIAARPSMGKTAIMMNIVESVCVDDEFPTMVFSAEMSRHQLTQRLVYSRARLSLSEVVAGFNPCKLDLQRIHQAGSEVARSPLFIDDTRAITISELRAKARRKHREVGLKLIAIDYLQLLKSTSKQAANSREREISEISSGIKALAGELGVPIIILAQLNRDVEKRTGKALGIPRLADLRESGSIEQDADMVGLLHRSAYYATTEEAKIAEAGKAELILAKNRHGQTGPVPLTFIENLTTFREGSPVIDAQPQQSTKNRFRDIAP